MFKYAKQMGAALLCGLVAYGCAGSQGVSKEVSNTCTADLDGMEMSVVLNAPAEDKEISSINFKFDLPFDVIREAAGAEADSSLSDSQVKEQMSEAEDMYKTMLGSMLGIEEEDIEVETKDDSLALNMTMKDLSRFKEFAGLEEDDSLIYKDVVKDLESNSEFSCD